MCCCLLVASVCLSLGETCWWLLNHWQTLSRKFYWNLSWRCVQSCSDIWVVTAEVRLSVQEKHWVSVCWRIFTVVVNTSLSVNTGVNVARTAPHYLSLLLVDLSGNVSVSSMFVPAVSLLWCVYRCGGGFDLLHFCMRTVIQFSLRSSSYTFVCLLLIVNGKSSFVDAVKWCTVNHWSVQEQTDQKVDCCCCSQ